MPFSFRVKASYMWMIASDPPVYRNCLLALFQLAYFIRNWFSGTETICLSVKLEASQKLIVRSLELVASRFWFYRYYRSNMVPLCALTSYRRFALLTL